MELILCLALGAVVYIIKVMGKLSSTNVGDNTENPKRVMGEAFPAIEVLEHESRFPKE